VVLRAECAQHMAIIPVYRNDAVRGSISLAQVYTGKIG
jgi:hypothetical protein